MSNCTICPRDCRADRENGRRGFCGVTGKTIKCARAALHMWEEPCISGDTGSGAVCFCQNRDIAGAERGIDVTEERLAEIFLELAGKGAANINLVTPTHYTPQIIRSVQRARENGLKLPIVYNCSGYEKVSTLKMLDGIVDIYLTDFKYMDREAAAIYSHAPDYPEVAKAAILEMYRQVGGAVIEDEQMTRGVIIRHLVLPGCIDNSLGVLDWIAESFPKKDVLVSLMSQYVPMGRAKTMPPLDRRITQEEYDAVLSYLYLLELDNGYTQDFSAATAEYIPDFDLEGL